jgi:hypothetical protein
VALGQTSVAEFGLTNIQSHPLDLCEANQERFGSFDYMIVHGLYSWVPPFVRERVLAICRELMTQVSHMSATMLIRETTCVISRAELCGFTPHERPCYAGMNWSGNDFKKMPWNSETSINAKVVRDGIVERCPPGELCTKQPTDPSRTVPPLPKRPQR